MAHMTKHGFLSMADPEIIEDNRIWSHRWPVIIGHM